MKKFILAVGMLMLAGQSFAIDKPRLEKHLRSMLGLDGRTPMNVGEATQSDFAALLSVPVEIGGSSYVVYMTPDEKKYFWGNLNDLTIDPDQAKMEKINFKNAWTKGSKSAPVTIVEYTDLQCPYCSRAHSGLSQDLYKKYTKDQVRVVFKHFPLPMHNWAEPAHVAAECAAQQLGGEAFWKVADYYFVNQQSVNKANFDQKNAELATQLKLNKTKFNQCMTSIEPLNKVRADKQEGSDIGVSSTPTIFINGRLRRGFSKFDDLIPLIDEKLAEAKARKK